MESRTQGSRPRTQNKSEAKGECSRIQVQVLSKKRSSKKIFQAIPPKKNKRKVFKKIFHVISKRGKQKKSSRIFREVSGVFELHFNRSKKNMSEKFSRTWGFEAKALTFEAKDFKMCPWVFHLNDFTSIMCPSPAADLGGDASPPPA